MLHMMVAVASAAGRALQEEEISAAASEFEMRMVFRPLVDAIAHLSFEEFVMLLCFLFTKLWRRSIGCLSRLTR